MKAAHFEAAFWYRKRTVSLRRLSPTGDVRGRRAVGECDVRTRDNAVSSP